MSQSPVAAQMPETSIDVPLLQGKDPSLENCSWTIATTDLRLSTSPSRPYSTAYQHIQYLEMLGPSEKKTP